ncbi:MAG: hypothetical protein FJ344_02540 [Sphingomonadales bacterium]|nr:hypothetical protein [Sphingomonadales bacterium]
MRIFSLFTPQFFPVVLFLLIAQFTSDAFAQGRRLSGRVIDSTDSTPLMGVNVSFRNPEDPTTPIQGTSTDNDGRFEITISGKQIVEIRISFVGYRPILRSITQSQWKDSELSLGNLRLPRQIGQLSEITVNEWAAPVEQKGDTTDIRADSYKVAEYADAEQLVRKMPGITIENGQIQAQGEQVKRVMLDGQEFMGNDATAALRSLPADVVDRIQIIDRMSDRAQFTGINDGNTEKTLNIITKTGLDNSRFGKTYAGVGTDSGPIEPSRRYMSGYSVNLFKGKKRVTLLGLANNINQQNFSSQDLSSLSEPDPMPWRTMIGNAMPGGFGRGMMGGGGGAAANFQSSQQGGISETRSFGVNFSDNWEKKGKMSASYFFSDGLNNQDTRLARNFFVQDGIQQQYQEKGQNNSATLSHRLSMRIEYNPDTSNSIVISPRFNASRRRNTQDFSGLNLGAGAIGAPVDSISRTDVKQLDTSYNLGLNGELVWRYKFPVRGRTFSFTLNGDLSQQDAVRGFESKNRIWMAFGYSDSLIDRFTDIGNGQNRIDLDLAYTEPVGKNGLIEMSYAPRITESNAFQWADRKDVLTGQYQNRDSVLSNEFDNRVVVHGGTLRYRYNVERLEWTFGARYQMADMRSRQTYPFNQDIPVAFYNWLPSAMIRYNITKTANLRFFYRTNAQFPSLSQLQNLVDVSNPLQLRRGNPDLRQTVSHTIGGRIREAKPVQGVSYFLFAMLNVFTDQIVNSTTLALRDTILDNQNRLPIVLGRGAQLIQPVNRDGGRNFRVFLNYSRPVKSLKSNLNINAGTTTGITPSLVNGVENRALNTNYNSGFSLNSNISRELDFSVGYTINYNRVRYSLLPNQNSDFFTHSGTFRFNYIPVPALILSSDLMVNSFSGLGTDFNQQIWLWNVGAGYRFLKDRRGELRWSVFDLLGQNSSITRNATETYVEDVETRLLQRFHMFTFTYNLRHFGQRPEPPTRGPWGGGLK